MLGNTPIPNRYIDVGHGVIGWTPSCVSADPAADTIDGTRPAIGLDDLAFASRRLS